MAGTGFLIGALSATIMPGDLEIGAVEIKDATTDTRAKVKTDGTDNALVVQINAQQLGVSADVLDIAAGADRSTQLPVGTYRISGNVDCWFKQGAVTVAAASQAVGSAFLAAGAIDTFHVDNTTNDGYLSVVYDATAGDTGKLSVTKQ